MASLSSVQSSQGALWRHHEGENSSFSSWWGWWGSGIGLNLDFFNSPGSVANYIFGTYSSKPTVLHEPGRTDGKLKLFANAHHKPNVIQNRPKMATERKFKATSVFLDLDIEIHGIDPWIWNLVTPHGIDLRRKLEQILRSLDFRYRL